ncbi:hypothetical protein KC357_g16 [Hortaea werneckii]|nr:hypothetical protein KC357_g16 [Hortaea werneckii]
MLLESIDPFEKVRVAALWNGGCGLFTLTTTILLIARSGRHKRGDVMVALRRLGGTTASIVAAEHLGVGCFRHGSECAVWRRKVLELGLLGAIKNLWAFGLGSWLALLHWHNELLPAIASPQTLLAVITDSDLNCLRVETDRLQDLLVLGQLLEAVETRDDIENISLSRLSREK